MDISIQTTNNIFIIFVAVLFTFTYIFWLYKFINKSVEKKTNRYLIIAFRTIAFLLLIAFLLNIQMNIRRTIMKKPTTVMIWDDSQSVGQTKNSNKIMQKVLDSDLYNLLDNETEVKHFIGHDEIFETNTRKVEKLKFAGDYTNISNMFSSLFSNIPNNKLNSIFLVSDGQSNFGKELGNYSSKNNTKIYSIGIGNIGENDKIKLIKITKLNPSKENDNIRIKLNLKNDGENEIAGRVSYQIDKGKILKFSDVNISKNRNVFIENEIKKLPQGNYNINWYYSAKDNDSLFLINNKFNLTIKKSIFDIVFCYDTPSPDIKFLKLAFSNNDNVKIYDANNYGKNQKPDLIICFSDKKNNWLKDEEIPKIIFVANSFTNLNNIKKLSSPKYIENYKLNKNYSFLFTEASVHKSIINWKKLPPVLWSGYQIPGKIILADAKIEAPLITYEAKNNIIYFSISKMWRWKLASYNKEWEGHYSNFINGLLNWMININDRKLVKIDEKKYRIDKYEEVSIPIKTNLENINPDSLKLICEVYDENNSELYRKYFNLKTGKINFNYKTKIAGNYKLIAKLYSNNIFLDSDTANINVSKINKELKYIGCNKMVLEELASNNNGLFVILSEVDSLVNKIQFAKRQYLSEHNFIARSSIFLLVLMFIFSIAEWIIRKKLGYL
ncbi:MAG: hypothetical protein U9N76_02625 [Candidatus Marinimicrobia bacterium]|nr:hypothetical protein [Candidatus Neomarinimicrobiota bacterium]